ncbi:amino acid permease [Streptomyces sp. FXJ1.4098]|nr:amino acid permease [Streptomyces sp. FXJ1.4098]
MLAFHNGINRYFHSLGTSGVLPRWLSRTNRQGAPYTASSVQTVIAIAMVVPFALAGADPVLTLLTWGGGVGVLALLLLYLLTSLSVIMFFRRTGLDRRRWNTLIAPLASIVLLLGAAALALENFTTLISASGTTALVLELTVVAVLAGGIVLGLLRRGGEGRTPSTSSGAAMPRTHRPLSDRLRPGRPRRSPLWSPPPGRGAGPQRPAATRNPPLRARSFTPWCTGSGGSPENHCLHLDM